MFSSFLFLKRSFEYDLFLCHAYEDQIALTDRLYTALTAHGIRVWYSAHHMEVGEDLEVIVEKIIPKCRYGLVVISRDYFTADWAKKELDVLRKHEKLRKATIILPMWHEVDEEQVKSELPFLVSRFAVRSDADLKKPVSRLLSKITGIKLNRNGQPSFASRYKKHIIAAALMIIFSLPVFYFYKEINVWMITEDEFVEQIEAHISHVDFSAQNAFNEWLSETRPKPSNTGQVNELRKDFTEEHAIRFPLCEFFTGDKRLHGNEHAQEFGITRAGLYNNFGYTFNEFINTDSVSFECGLYNPNDVSYQIIDVEQSTKDQAIVTVRYDEPLRYVLSKITRSGRGKQVKHFLQVHGFRSSEKYVFERINDRWQFIAL